MTVLYIVCAVAAVLLLFTVIELVRLLRMKPLPDSPDKSEAERYSLNIGGKSFEDMYLFLCGRQSQPSFTEDEVYSLLLKQTDFMKNRFDCADFRAQMLFKIYKDCNLSERCSLLIKNAFLGFKYFITEPGDDSMCYWSENHQILFAVSEYLAGQEWQDEIFTNNGMTGKEHMVVAEKRINAWMKQRYDFGFSEYLSNNYLAEDIAPMANYIAYSHDRESVERMKIIMDILWLDVAHCCVGNRFVAVSPRMYGNNKTANSIGNSIQCAMNILWGNDLEFNPSASKKPNYIVLCFTDAVEKGLYTLPEVIKDIALYDGELISEMSFGLSAQDMADENLIGQDDASLMAQTGAETFTDSLIINNTLEFLKKNNLYKNKFLSMFRFLNLSVFRFVDWQKFASRHEIMPHGISLGRGNVVTYRNKRYSLSTDICKNVGVCGAQEQVWTADISENLALFTTHPSGDGNSRFSASPGYWIGNGRRPMSVQHENVNITIYKLPDKKRLGEKAVASMTHAYMPLEFYDESEHCGNIVFARKDGIFVALISNGEMKFKPFDRNSANGLLKGRAFPDGSELKSEFDLCRYGGEYHIYITELSDEDKETFEEFRSRIRNNSVEFRNDGYVCYTTKSASLEASYDGIFNINGESARKEFERYNSKFCKAKRKSDVIIADSGRNRLILDYKNAKRSTDCV